jgi:hypothetical protein
MSKSLDPLKITTPELHRFYINLETVPQWYAVMRECRQNFGTNWRTQPKVKRKLSRTYGRSDTKLWVWFEVPDLRFPSWVALKLATAVCQDPPGK